MNPDPARARIEAALWERIRRHLPADVIEEAGTPTVEWVSGHSPPIGETVIFRFDDRDGLETQISFAPDDAVLVQFRQNGMIRIDAWRTGQRGVVFDWRREDADWN